ncbi:flagellar biosynthetic protein FliO [Noviherbaspirillum galbum]|nr:flagellar biosynthetic protein FliO [Noviherbaspirillum galbum]
MLAPLPAWCADAPASSPVGGMAQVTLGLLVVLGLMAGAAWLLKRIGVGNAAAGSVAKIVGGVSVGNRERVLVVEVADQWIVVGVAPGRVNALSTMPRQQLPDNTSAPATPANFAAWLKQSIEKRNEK